jgi:hypothetical protein
VSSAGAGWRGEGRSPAGGRRSPPRGHCTAPCARPRCR